MKARSASMSMAVDSNDLQSALAEKGLAISISPEKGRCLIAKRSFTRGEIVLLQDPYVSVLDSASVNKRCDVCFRLCTNLKRCSVCKTTWYCGGTCQRNGWRLHQHECKAITSLKEEKQQTPTPSLQLMLRLLIKRKLQNAGVISKMMMDNYNLVEALPSHMSDFNEKQLVLYAQMANLVNIIKPSEELNLKEITQNFCRFSCNAHTICDSELRPMGTGLYPVISIINHSCFPNAVLLFEGRQAVVRAVEPIREGSELTVSYIEIAASTASRKKSLKEQYFFDCKCLRCLKVDTPDGLHEDAILEGFRCSSDHCEGFLLHDPDDAQSLVCQLCGCGRNEEETKKQARKVDKLGKEASKLLSSGNYSEARSLYEQIQQLQTQLWHPYSVILLRTGDTLLKICMELYDWKQALKYCRLTIPAYERAYPTCHPMMGLQYYACGKLEWFLPGPGCMCPFSVTTHLQGPPFKVIEKMSSMALSVSCTSSLLSSKTLSSHSTREIAPQSSLSWSSSLPSLQLSINKSHCNFDRQALIVVQAAWTRRSKSEADKNPRKKSWKQRTDMYMRPFLLDVFISKKYIHAKVMHRVTSKVVSVATTNARDLRNTLPSLTDLDACRTIGKLIAERSKEADVYAMSYEPRKGERVEGKLGVILDTIKENDIAFV